jgi:ankyrin repeat protein
MDSEISSFPRLWELAQQGRSETLQSALQDPGIDSVPDRDSVFALVKVAAANGWHVCVAALLQEGAVPFGCRAELARHAIRTACTWGTASVVGLVLGMQPLVPTSECVGEFQRAARRGHDDVVRKFIECRGVGLLALPRGAEGGDHYLAREDEDDDDDGDARQNELETAGRCALRNALKFQHASTVKLLVDIKASPRDTVVTGQWRLLAGHGPALELLLSVGMSPVQTWDGKSLLTRAVERDGRDLAVAQLLMNAKADVDVAVLRAAAATNDGERFHFLRLLVPAAECSPEDLGSVLTTVARAKCEHSGALLIAAGARPTQRDLWSAVNHLDVLKLLLKSKADVRERDADVSYPPVFLASTPEAVEMLLAAGASVDERQLDGTTVLHYLATRYGVRPGTITALVGAKADPCATAGPTRSTPLHKWTLFHWSDSITFPGGSNGVLGELLRAKACLGAADASGNTPLHLCCKGRQKVYSVDVLLASKAPVDAVNAYGRTPLQVLTATSAAAIGVLDAARLLLEAKADPNSRSGSSTMVPMHVYRAGMRETPLHSCCVSAGRHMEAVPDLMRMLVGAKADVNRTDALCRTPLHTLVSTCTAWEPGPACNVATDAVQLLVQANASVFIEDGKGRTVLASLICRAVAYGQVRLLPVPCICSLASALAPAYHDTGDWKLHWNNARAHADAATHTRQCLPPSPDVVGNLWAALLHIRRVFSEYFQARGFPEFELHDDHDAGTSAALVADDASPVKRTRKASDSHE